MYEKYNFVFVGVYMFDGVYISLCIQITCLKEKYWKDGYFWILYCY